jgi:hypothetical protein
MIIASAGFTVLRIFEDNSNDRTPAQQFVSRYAASTGRNRFIFQVLESQNSPLSGVRFRELGVRAGRGAANLLRA